MRSPKILRMSIQQGETPNEHDSALSGPIKGSVLEK